MSHWKLAVAVAALLLVSSAPTRTADQMLIAAGSTWRYNDSGANLGTAWSASLYTDNNWPTGAAQLGYGDGDESTVMSYGSSTTSRRITYYLRHHFNVSNPSAFNALSARYMRDDGAVIYLNGVEVTRSNMPAGPVSYTTLATVAIGGADESAWLETPIDPALLVVGDNVLAVEIHQQSGTSSDVSFDLELRAVENRPPLPTVSLTSPAHQGVTNTSEVTFAASVSAPAGLQSATLYIGGPPETVVFSGPSHIQDAQISADTPTTPAGSGLSLKVDGLTPHAHSLMKFPTLIGSGAVPAGAVVASATLQVNCTNIGNAMRLYRLTQDWVEDQATWNQRATGLAWGSAGADGASSNAGVALTGDCTSTGLRLFDVTQFVQEWANDPSNNYGIVLIDSGTDGIDFASSESTASPVLTVAFKSSQTAMPPQELAGITADVTFTVEVPLGQTYFWNVKVTDAIDQQSWAPVDFQLTADANAPDAPVLVSPADESGNVSTSPTLSATVSDPGGGQLDVSVELRRAAAPEFTIIAMPDTQFYSESYPTIFTSQTQWIVDNKDARNIVFVTHEGDIVNQNTAIQWQRANQNLSMLDGVVPYGMGPGNHDLPTTMYNQNFPYTRYQSEPWYGGHYQNLNDNNYQLISAGGMDFVFVHLEYCPPAGAVAWADSIYKSYPNHIGFMTTHAYLNESAQRATHGCLNTQYLWDGLAVPNPNLHFMLSGHVHDESRRSDVANGHPVYQMLADYQGRANGGEGWLRILRFVPGESKVYVQTYSPWLNRFETDANSEFSLDFPMGDPFQSAGSMTAPSGSTAFVNPATLAPDTEYEWRVTVTNTNGKSQTSPVWTFKTAYDGTINRPPVAASQSFGVSEDGSMGITLGASDPDADELTYSVVNGPAHGTLTGPLPTVVYQPNANYSGADSFTFRASDGEAMSNVATVSVAVQPVNDPPVAVTESYSVQGGSTLSVSLPGVLGNDTDIDSASLTAGVMTVPAHGNLSLATNGSFSYTPTAGYSGPDSFTYRASDGTAFSGTTVVSITVQPAPPPPPVTLFTANFNSGSDSFTYVDNTFRGATQSSYASGSRVSSGGFTGGALRVRLGGENSNTINGMSGGYRRTFTLSTPRTVILSFRYNLDQGSEYESDEFSQVLASVDGVLKGVPPADYIAQVAGNGNGGSPIGTGWQLFQQSLGTLPAGTHTVILGGYNNRKNSSSERTTILIDDVSVTAQ